MCFSFLLSSTWIVNVLHRTNPYFHHNVVGLLCLFVSSFSICFFECISVFAVPKT